jgi:hypothetical protein
MLKKMKVAVTLVCLAVLGVFFVNPAYALTPGETIVLSWQTPMERVDGTPLSTDELDYYTVICNGYNTGNAESILTLPVNGNGAAREVARTDLFKSYGHYKCRIKVTDSAGTDGKWSEYVEVNWRDSKPSPAFNIMIVVDQ